MHTAPVIAVLVCHDGEPWLGQALSGLRESTVRPRRVVAVETGSADQTAQLLAEAATGAEPILDEVLSLPAETGFAAALTAGVDHAHELSGGSAQWIWVLHDDCVPEPDCLAALLNAAEAAPSAGMVGPISLDWVDPRLVVEAGLATDTSGHRRTEVGLSSTAQLPGGSDQGVDAEQSTEVLAVPSSGALLHAALWTSLGGFDTDLRLLWEDIDFGWRANVAGRTVLCVPRARMRHARAVTQGLRMPAALAGPGAERANGMITGPASGDHHGGRPGQRGSHQPQGRAVLLADRANGIRTYLVNCGRPAFLVGLVRLALLGVLRSIGFLLIGMPRRSGVELTAIAAVWGGSCGLRAARAQRRSRLQTGALSAHARSGRTGSVRGLIVGRLTRLRLALRAGARYLRRRHVARDAALGKLAHESVPRSEWSPVAGRERTGRTTESRAVPDSTGGGSRDVTAVALPAEAADAEAEPASEGSLTTQAEPVGATRAQRPTPGVEPEAGEFSSVQVQRKRIRAATVFAPPVLLVLGLTALALVVHSGRLGLDLAGGRLLPVGDLGQVWSNYLAAWHSTGGGTSAHAPPALAVLGILGAPLFPLGGPPAVVAVLVLFAMPIAGLSAYVATRRLTAPRWVRALAAIGYALLPAATAASEQGRVGVVVAHVLLPLVIAGVAGVLRPSLAADPAGARWLSSSVAVALGLAVLGAFSPLTHLVVLVGLLLGFVLVPSTARLARRIGALAIVALLPLALLLPWLVTLVTHPELILHGIGAHVPDIPVHAGLLFSLHPGGVGALPIGALLVAAALVAMIVRPTKHAFIGLAVAAFGAATVAVSRTVALAPVGDDQERNAWPGVGLLVVGVGLLLVLVLVPERHAGRDRPPASRLPVGFAAVGGLFLAVAFVGSAVFGGQGPMAQASTTQLPSSVAAELAESGESLLVLRDEGYSPRQAAAGRSMFGSATLPLPTGSLDRLNGWQAAVLGSDERPPGSDEELQDVVASAAAAGVRFVVLPPDADGADLVERGSELVSSASSTADGRDVVRLNPVGGQVSIIAPELTRLAGEGEAPPGDVEGDRVVPVEASLPDVRVRVSDGASGRLLVLAATHEAGWRASVDGEAAPIVEVWGHQVGVELPTRESEVVVEHSAATRNLLLLGQLGAVLFTVLAALPSGTRSRR